MREVNYTMDISKKKNDAIELAQLLSPLDSKNKEKAKTWIDGFITAARVFSEEREKKDENGKER